MQSRSNGVSIFASGASSVATLRKIPNVASRKVNLRRLVSILAAFSGILILVSYLQIFNNLHLDQLNRKLQSSARQQRQIITGVQLAKELKQFNLHTCPAREEEETNQTHYALNSGQEFFQSNLSLSNDFTRKSIYLHELYAHGKVFSRYGFVENDLTPRCSDAGVTVFNGPALVARCASIITDKFVFMVNDFPTIRNDPPQCFDFYNKYFRADLDGEAPLNQRLNVLEHFIANHSMTLIAEKSLVPVVMPYGYSFPHVIKDTMPRVMLSIPYLFNNPEAKLLVERSPAMELMLQRMGVPLERVLFTREKTREMTSHWRPSHRTMYMATEELAYPHCFPGPMSTGMYAAEIYHSMRDLLVGKPPLETGERLNIVYVTREGGDNLLMRRIDNEKVLLERMQRIIHENWPEGTSFTKPRLIRFRGGHHTSLEDSIEIFRNARVVFGPHGGGFYNLIFAAPGTHVIELSPDDYGKNEVSRFSTLLHMKYQGFVKSGMNRTETFGAVDIDWFIDEVLHAFDASKIPAVPQIPAGYIKHKKFWQTKAALASTPEEARQVHLLE